MNLKTKIFDSGYDIGHAVDTLIEEIEQVEKQEKRKRIFSSTPERQYILSRIDLLKQKTDAILIDMG